MTQEELPIERGFPIEHVNDIAEKEGRAKMHYRPIYTMHKWWARRLGCVFRAICLYTLVDDAGKVEVHEPGENSTISESSERYDVQKLIDNVDIDNPDSLWKLYPKDVRVKDKKILDPFMGGGTSLVEASRFGVESVGYDLNPVAWFVTKKQLEAGSTNIEDLEEEFKHVENDVADEITRYYRTPCPNSETQGNINFDKDDPLGLDADFPYEVPEGLRGDMNVYDHYADVMYYFWVKELECVYCDFTIPLFKDYRIAKGRYGNDDKYHVLCPKCESIVLVDNWQEESRCSECNHDWKPDVGNVSGSDYSCPDCGAQYPITDAIQEQGDFNLRLYAVEYYCPICDDRGRDKDEVKSYRQVTDFDEALYEVAKQEWGAKEELHEYVPNEEIPAGWYTTSTKFEGRSPGAHDLHEHGYHDWVDMFSIRQLLSLSKLFRSIDSLENRKSAELLVLAASESLRYTNMMVSYNTTYNKIGDLFRTNSFDPPTYPIENNVWGTDYGSGTFSAMYDMIKDAVEYANFPTERYITNGETVKTKPFNQTIGQKTKIYQSDMRSIEEDDKYDVVITDPPYYDNIIYSELSDYFYVWQKIILKDDYECFGSEATPRSDSMVVNPAEDKDKEDFELELNDAFNVIHRALKDNGILTFTYHHSDSESWGELLTALCDVGFEVTATYPISADINKFTKGEAVEFDIIVVARPTEQRDSISWNDLRLKIYDTARRTRKRLEQNRELSRGDIGVIEMGECFQEYSKYHGNVYREGEVMNAKEVVDEIYGIIQEASEIGATEVFIDLLETEDPDFDDVNKLCRGANTTPNELKEMRLFNTDDGFELGTWSNEKRIAYLQDELRDGELTALDKLHLLRYRYNSGKRIGRYVEEWLNPELRRLAVKLADVTGDEVYEGMLDIRAADEGKAREEGGQSQIDEFEEDNE